MHSRFTTNVLLLLLGGALAAVALAQEGAPTRWSALGVALVALATTLVAFASLDRGAAQRGLDAAVLALGAFLAAASQAFSGDALRWIVVGSAAGLCGLAVLGLVLHEEARGTARRSAAMPAGPSTNGSAGAPAAGAPAASTGWTATGPLARSYWSAAALVVLALVPYLVLSTTVSVVGEQIGADVGLGEQGMALTNGMSNAAYAVGAVVALQLTVHLRGRRLLVGYAALFVLASVLAAWAPTPGLFVAGRVVQGLTTGLLLIAAVPPLVLGWPPARLTTTAMVMNMGIFGAVAAGPVIGGLFASAGDGSWRVLFWVVTGLGGAAFLLSLLTFFDQEPADRTAPWAPSALILAATGCGLTFFGSAQLTSHPFVSTWVMLPLLAGVATIVVLVIQQFRSAHPLMPVRRLTSTFPVVGILVALTAGASSVAIIELVQGMLLQKGTSPGHVGLLFLPQVGGALLAATLFGLLFHTKWTKVIALSGLVLVAGAAAVLVGAADGGEALVWIGTALLGFGVGASVAPALFIAGFSLPSNNVPRIFSLIELLRAVAAFSVAPILIHVATTGADPVASYRTSMWICLAIAAGGASLAVYLFVLARARPHHPKIDRWVGGEEPAFDSPAIAAALRGLATDPRHHSESPGRHGPADGSWPELRREAQEPAGVG